MKGFIMPIFDGTGPNGYGPMTGHGMGKCQQEVVIERQAQPRRGMGRGPGFGKGQGRGLGLGKNICPFAKNQQATQSIEDKIKALQAEKNAIEETIKILEEERNKNG
jgi:hypothetical protein